MRVEFRIIKQSICVALNTTSAEIGGSVYKNIFWRRNCIFALLVCAEA